MCRKFNSVSVLKSRSSSLSAKLAMSPRKMQNSFAIVAFDWICIAVTNMHEVHVHSCLHLLHNFYIQPTSLLNCIGNKDLMSGVHTIQCAHEILVGLDQSWRPHTSSSHQAAFHQSLGNVSSAKVVPHSLSASSLIITLLLRVFPLFQTSHENERPRASKTCQCAKCEPTADGRAQDSEASTPPLNSIIVHRVRNAQVQLAKVENLQTDLKSYLPVRNLPQLMLTHSIKRVNTMQKRFDYSHQVSRSIA